MSRITAEDVRHVARLARLELSEEEIGLFTGQLGDVLEHAEDIEAMSTEGVPPTGHPLELANVLREDTVGECLDREEVLAAAPRAEDGRFRVPSILGDPA